MERKYPVGSVILKGLLLTRFTAKVPLAFGIYLNRDFGISQAKLAYAIMPVGNKESVELCIHKRKPPEGKSEGFFG